MFANPRCRADGFSLLEVIIATAIIAASSMVLLRLISTGGQHQQRAERRANGQLICQSLIDRMLIGTVPLEAVDEQRVADDPDWIYSTQIQPSDYPGIARVRVAAALSPVDVERTRGDGAFDYELIRWLRVPTAGQFAEDSQ
jgi:prepilin-type N-terminal cleavage/methylation domain-containing protein